MDIDPFVDGIRAVESGGPEGFNALFSLFGLDAISDCLAELAKTAAVPSFVSSSPNLIYLFSFPAVTTCPFETLRLVLRDPCEEPEETRSSCGANI